MAPARLLVLLASALLLTVPGAAASNVEVPAMVLQGSVPFLVTGAAAGSNVTMTVGTVANHQLTSAASHVFILASVPAGWHVWTATVSGSPPESFSGTIYVDTSLAALIADLNALEAALAATQDDVEATDAAVAAAEANLTARIQSVNKTARETLVAILTATTGSAPLPGNVTEAVRRAATEVFTDQALSNADLDSKVSTLQETADGSSVAAQSATTWATYAALAAAAAALLMIAVGMLLFVQLQRTRQEFLVYVLALAAHSGITPESPEFQQALSAIGHSPKGSKAKDDAEGPAKPSRKERLAEKKKAKAAEKALKKKAKK